MLSVGFINLDRFRAEGGAELMVRHWEEVEHDKEEITLAPDWERAYDLERLGWYFILAAHLDGSLIGYNIFTVCPHIHYRNSVHAFNSALYVCPEHRGRAGVRLIREAERRLKVMGAVRVHYAAKVGVKVGRRGSTTGDVLAKMGYRHYEDMYSRLL